MVTMFVMFFVVTRITSKRWRNENLDRLEQYKTNRLNKLKTLLEDENFPGFSKKKYMAWLIESCDKAIDEDSSMGALKKTFSKFFNVIAFPIITFCSGLLVKSLNDTDAIVLAVLALFLLMLGFFAWYAISPAIERLMNRDRLILKTLKGELEFLMLELD